VLEKYPKDVKLVIKHFSIHSFARKSAIAALAAGKQGRFWEFHEKLFANQKELSDAKVEKIAQELRLNMEQFKQDLKDPSLGLLIDRDLNDGLQAKIRATPTIFVNGRLLSKESLSGLREAIEAELKKRR
jgi:protein-disulfide isomerase